MTPLFDPSALAALAVEVAPSAVQSRRAIELLRQLAERQLASLAGLTETRVEQSFNERIFSEVFEYTTLFRSAKGGAFDLLPKTHHQHVRRFDDFALGFFGLPEPDRRVALAEFKSPGTDLDRDLNTNGETAVQQAHATAALTPEIEWVLVSDFDEIRVYRRGDQMRYESVRLTEIDSVAAFRRAYALLGKRSLIAPADSLLPAPLLRLLQEGTPMLLAPRAGYVRLLHEASVVGEATRDALVHRLDDALAGALARTDGLGWPPRLKRTGFDHEQDRISETSDRQTGRACRIEFTASGVLRVVEHMGEPLDAKYLASRMASFVALARHAIRSPLTFGGTNIHFRWRLMDTKKGLRVTCAEGWMHPTASGEVVLPNDRPWCEGAIADDKFRQNKVALAENVTAAVRELLYPFSWRQEPQFSEEPLRIYRVSPAQELVASAIAEAASVFEQK